MKRKTVVLTLIALLLAFSLAACEVIGSIPIVGELLGDRVQDEEQTPDSGESSNENAKPDDGKTPTDDDDSDGEQKPNDNQNPEGKPDDDGGDTPEPEPEPEPDPEPDPEPEPEPDPEPETKYYELTVHYAQGPLSDAVFTSTYPEGSLISAPDINEIEGYEFDGWYSDQLFENEWNFDNDVIISNMNIYAKWNEIPKEILPAKIFLVGDSTVCSFADNYYYPRYGYGTQLGEYLTDKATVVNLALSGRSSKSFITESNYETLKNSISAGDYLIIGFGHNDEKVDDDTRFTDASKPYTDETSFGYYLYEYYIKLAQEKGATPILCTPIVRASSKNDYTGSEGHITATGDYTSAIISLGEALGVPVVDLTGITKAEYSSIGYDEVLKYHAVIGGKYASDGTTVVPNVNSVDKTHLNIYGAKFVAYSLACELEKIKGIGDYVLDGITAPDVSMLVPNPNYIVPDYESPNLENYNPIDKFSTISEGWYGTAFGNTGGDPTSNSNGYIAKETSEGAFSVGCTKNNKGKFENASDGFAFVFRQVEADKNFVLTATATITESAGVKQAGFGLMLRDDCIIGQTATDTINTNYLTAGICAHTTDNMSVLFYRENSSLKKGTNLSGTYKTGDVAELTIERIGQTVTVTVVYGGVTYTESYYDFDLFARDTEYMYVGMFANRGTVVEFTNVEFTVTGESMGA